jgi:hypothetical protein
MNSNTHDLPYATYHVIESAAHMPNSCWGRYRRFAVVRVAPGGSPPAIIRDTKTARVVSTWEKCRDGSTDRCAAAKARKAAYEDAERRQTKARDEYLAAALG